MNNVTSLLQSFGVNIVQAAMLVPTMWYTSGASDPLSNSVILIVEGAQRGLNKMGCPLKVDGKIGPQTDMALQWAVGKNWRSLTWFSIYTSILDGIKRGKKCPQIKEEAPGSGVPVVASGIPFWAILAGGGALAYFLFLRKKGGR